VLQHANYDLHRGQISPDGQWLAFGVPVESQGYRVLDKVHNIVRTEKYHNIVQLA